MTSKNNEVLMLLSRRSVVVSSLLAVPAITSAMVDKSYAAPTPPRRVVTSTVHQGSMNTWVSKIMNPATKPAAGVRWHQRINTRVSENSFYTLLLSSKTSGGFGLQIEKVVNGRREVLKSVSIDKDIYGSPFEMNFNTRLPFLYGELRQNGSVVASVDFLENGEHLTGNSVTVSTYIESGGEIDFREKTIVTPYDTPPGPLDAGPKWDLVFNDDFNSPSIDLNKWNVRDSSPALSYANEAIANRNGAWSIAPGNTPTLNSADCIQIKDGNAEFKIEKLESPRIVDHLTRTYKGGYIDTGYPITNNLTHRRDRSKPTKFSEEFMRIEIRAKMPAGKKSAGNHACLWLRPDDEFLPKNDKYGTSPSLEIDINEFYDGNYLKKENNFDTTNRTETSVHFDQTGKNKADGWTNGKPDYGIRWIPRGEQQLQDEFHTWVLELTPHEGIKVFYDNSTLLIHVPASDPRLIRAKKKGVKMHIRLNFEGGKNYWGSISEESENDLSGRFIVDYIRAWRYKA